jgi:hypothetical protein
MAIKAAAMVKGTGNIDVVCKEDVRICYKV